MDGDTHYAPALRSFIVELIELRLTYLDEVVTLIVLPEQDAVVYFDGIRHRDHLPRLHLDRYRLVVVHPVAVVDEPRFRHKVRAVLRTEAGRAKHPLELFPCMASQGIDGVLIPFPLSLLRPGIDILGIVDAMAHEVPVPTYHGFGHLGKMLKHR